MAGGVRVEDVYYMFLDEIDGKVVYAKKQLSGVTPQASNTAIIVARTGEGMQQGNANKVVGNIVAYLENMNL